MFIADVAHDNAKLVAEIAKEHQMTHEIALKVLDMTLGFELAVRNDESREIADILIGAIADDIEPAGIENPDPAAA